MSSLRASLDPAFRVFLIGVLTASLFVSAEAGFAQDRSPRDHDKPRSIPNYHILTDTPRRDTAAQNFHFLVKVKGGNRLLGAGDLWLGEYDGARFETDLQDINPTCGFEDRRRSSRNNSLVLSLLPVDLVDGYRFRLKTYWTHRLPQCDELRSDISWINIPVEIEEGETKAFDGDSGLVVELTRKAWTS
ncbi:MAG: hypothetical protein WBA51_19395 [Erythrobacter sp.]